MVPFSEKDLVAVNEKVQLEALKSFYGRWEDLVDMRQSQTYLYKKNSQLSIAFNTCLSSNM